MSNRTIGITGIIICITPAFLLSVLASGCGSSTPGIKTVPVTGVVKLNGQPLPTAVVTFHEVTGKANPCSGTTDEKGVFKLGFGSYVGAMSGNYKVTIEYLTKPDGTPLKPEPGMDAMQLKMQGLAVQALPVIYSDPAYTTLKADVALGTSEKLDFDLSTSGS